MLGCIGEKLEETAKIFLELKRPENTFSKSRASQRTRKSLS